MALGALFASSARAQGPVGPAAPPPDERCGGGPDEKPGVVWRGADPRLTLPQIAGLVAPVLWFSSDEPLLVRGEGPLPSAHPCDRPSDSAVVYYQARRLKRRGDRNVTLPAEDDPEFFAKVDSVAIRFYFYYPQDIGLSPHQHDLEVAEMIVHLDRDANGCGAVRVEEVIGFAHGQDWYYNRLVVGRDTRLPITILVEEGKHASCPDRNADGFYSPGYDVNRRSNDAWGVRDVLGSGYIGSGAYQSWMTKPRDPAFRVLPPPAPRLCEEPECSSLARYPENLGTYELRRADTVSMAGCRPPPTHAKDLADMMKAHRFGSAYAPEQYKSSVQKALADPLTATRRLIPSVALRWDNKLGFSFTLPGFDLRVFYLVPKINIVRGVSAEALITTSAAQFYSPYVSVGLAWESQQESSQLKFAAEGGFRFRYRLHGWARVISLGYPFAGFRFGLRMTGFNDVDNLRFVVEFGAGAW